ncbi:hypothetical protein ABIA35_003490 [Catenulispora sp. MAP12-49]|uniref:discoidin domain-containing protein n=1 Tax=Catenulispora sp. MAP12-49 TaxID=3156302 RepID=UPI0035122604
MVAVAAISLATAGLAGMNVASASGSVGSDGSGGVVVGAGYLRIGMDGTGQVTSLADARTGVNYLATGHGTAPLVSLMVGGQQVMPSTLTLSGNTLVFTGSGGFEVDVAVQDMTTYSTLTVTKATAPNGGDLQTLLWGPLPTDITQTLGESVGIVRDNNFAIGMKPLTDRTEGGWPREEVNTGIGWENQVAANPSNVQVAPLEEWSVGASTSWGTLLRAFTFDYTKQRNRMTDADGNAAYPIPVGPLPNGQGSVVGSKIALYGTTPDMALTELSNIAKDQGLPYPTINGQWQKAAQATSQSILVVNDLNTGDVDQAASLAKAGGMNMVYALGSTDGPWQTDGHYQFDGSFGGTDTAATALVNQAKADGIQVGTHTLSDFVSYSDPYAAPSMSPDLTVGTATTATQSIAAGDTTVYLASCAPLASSIQGHLMKLDSEVVSYGTVTPISGGCQVSGLGRGSWSTPATSHPAGATVTRIPQNAYGGGIGGLNIINAVATRFATIWNTTGVDGMSFDGLESASQSGWGAYGLASLVNGTFRQQNSPDGFISETSREGSNIWDGISRASWGEVGSTSMNQLYIHNAYYQANYLPGMLGWIGLDGNGSLSSLEDTLARAASFNAGSGFRTSISSLANGSNTATLLNAIKQWDTARNLGAFTPAQQAAFRDQSTHWHLSVITAGQSWSLQQLDASGANIGSPQTVTAPTPAFPNTALPGMTAGSLYEARAVANVPSIIHYAVTAGALPAGLTLNADTGGITGIPTTGTPSTFTITGTGAPGTANAQQTFTIGAGSTPTAGTLDLTSAFNNVGITSQSNVTPGNFDGQGNSFSAEQLSAAGITPGSMIPRAGSAFLWPNVAAGSPDNVAGSSAVIQGGGHGGSTLFFLGSEAGDVTDNVTVTYTDGTTTTGTIGFPNWADSSPTEFGSTLAISTQGRDLQSGYGDTTRTFRLFTNQITIDPTKTIATVTLPANSKIHTFALTAGTLNGTNLSQGKPATASSTESSSYPASNAVDGNSSTRWSSQFSDPQWLQVDLGTPQTFTKVVLSWEAAYGKDYQIQTSNDATNWTTVYTRTGGTGGTETLTGFTGTGRYVRMYGTARGTQWGYSLYEFQVIS